ncbi:neuronal pentraxin-2 [Lasius niger]|uniref:Neuronal pentraxin-2 n=1 Tax=Lasius niger TaxID=67767 RepID=A0A0J7NPE4_LASNI|nr:neuronal pentraxin-2 [Lasius niger]
MTSILLAYATLIAFSCVAQAISSSWRPILPAHNVGASILHQEASIFENAPTQTLYDVDGSHHLLLSHEQEKCSLYKVAMTQQLYFEVGGLPSV